MRNAVLNFVTVGVVMNMSLAQEQVIELMKRELARNPGASIYDICFRFEQFLDRKTYHAVLAWADGMAGCR